MLQSTDRRALAAYLIHDLGATRAAANKEGAIVLERKRERNQQNHAEARGQTDKQERDELVADEEGRDLNVGAERGEEEECAKHPHIGEQSLDWCQGSNESTIGANNSYMS